MDNELADFLTYCRLERRQSRRSSGSGVKTRPTPLGVLIPVARHAFEPFGGLAKYLRDLRPTVDESSRLLVVEGSLITLDLAAVKHPAARHTQAVEDLGAQTLFDLGAVDRLEHLAYSETGPGAIGSGGLAARSLPM